MEIRDRFIEQFTNGNQYGKLTQSYVQKAFTLFNLLLSINFAKESNQPPITNTLVSNTQKELIETQLNIKYLLLCQSYEKRVLSHDYSRYEIELVRFVAGNELHVKIIQNLLPSTKNLYSILHNENEFYPFGVIKAYEILSLLASTPDAFEVDSELNNLTAKQLLKLMATASEQEGIDEITEAMWKYISAQLKHIDPLQFTAEQISNIILHLRNSAQSYRSPGLRRTVTEIFSIIVKYFVKTNNLELLINFTELLLSLLRDDDVYVRNRTSEIVMDLIHAGENIQKGNLFR